MKTGDSCGPYRIVREIGTGGMGAVFEALGKDDAPVAVKVLLSLTHRADVRARFEREAKVCAALRHQHVVPVTDFGVDPAAGSPYLVMPRLDGEDLDRCVERNGPLEPAVASAIILQAASGLEAAHERSIVHRDVKPSNVFLEREPTGRLRAVVLDFGIAKVADEDGTLTASGVILGTPLYMAPEQLRGEAPASSWDIWALSVIAFELLCGTHPFGGVSLQLSTGTDAASTTDTLPGPALACLTVALSIDRAARPTSARQFVDDLERSLHD